MKVAANLPADVRIHDLRHLMASRLANAGTPLNEIGVILDNGVLATTVRYVHFQPARLVETAAIALPGVLGDPDAILTTAEAARRLRVSPKTMAYWRMTGDGPCYLRLGSRSIRYRPADLATYMDGRRQMNTTETHARR